MPKTFAPGMPALLESLERWLRRHRPAYHKSLRPGVPERQLMQFERELGRNLPPGLRALYRWHDGQDGDCPLALQHRQRFMPLADVRAARAALGHLLAAGEFPEENWWSPAWVPFLDNGAGDHLCVDVDGAFAGVRGQVVSFFHDWECRNVEFPNLEGWLTAFVVGVEAGLWEEDGAAFEPVDAGRVRAMQARLSPGYPRECTAGTLQVARGQFAHGW